MRKRKHHMRSKPTTPKGRASKWRIVNAGILGGRHIPRRYRAADARKARMEAAATNLVAKLADEPKSGYQQSAGRLTRRPNPALVAPYGIGMHENTVDIEIAKIRERVLRRIDEERAKGHTVLIIHDEVIVLDTDLAAP